MSAPSSTPASQTPAAPTTVQEVLPSPTTLLNAARLAIKDDKPIQVDYYVDSALKKAFIGEDSETKEKLLVKNNGEEFTSLISKVYKIQDDFIISTENSIYIVSAKIERRKINAAKMRSVEYEQL